MSISSKFFHTLYIAVALLFMLSTFQLNAENPKAAVTYNLSGGRFGDNLLAYMHAKWVSYSFGIPLYYRPFEYSDQLKLHILEKHLPQKLSIKPIQIKKAEFIDVKKPFLYYLPFFPEIDFYFKFRNKLETNKYHHFFVPWEDRKFRELLLEAIHPIEDIPLVCPPADRLSVALHIRTGGSSTEDASEEWKKRHGSKFLPLSYYLDQLNNLCTHVGSVPLYVYLFTDDDNPRKFLEEFKTFFPNDNIQWDTRTIDNQHNLNVLEDFFSLRNFDCLIRSDSHFSIIPALLKDYAIQMFPSSYEEIPEDIQKFSEVMKINKVQFQKALERIAEKAG